MKKYILWVDDDENEKNPSKWKWLNTLKPIIGLAKEWNDSEIRIRNKQNKSESKGIQGEREDTLLVKER